MQNNYERAEIEVIKLGEDIIRTSGDGIDLPDLDLTEI